MVSALVSDDRSPRVTRDGGPTRGRARSSTWAPALAVALGLLPGVACNAPLTFHDRPDTGMRSDVQQPPADDAGPDVVVVPVDAGSDVSAADAPIDVPVDLPVDMPTDTPRDVPQPDVRPDVVPDVAPDVPRDVPPDLPRDVPTDVPRDAGGPVVCAVAADCKLPGLVCLTGAGPGSCVECLGDTNCAGRRCNTTLHRCVDCLTASDCPTADDSHPSACTTADSFRCLNGCDDSGPACTTTGFLCNTTILRCIECPNDNAACASSSNGPICKGMVCMRCGQNSDCQAGAPICDFISGRCVQCRTSLDCTTPGLPLCNPVSLACVALPP